VGAAKTGKGTRGGAGSVSGTPAATEDDGDALLRAHAEAEQDIATAEAAVKAARQRLQEVRVTLGRHFVPNGARKGEKFNVWQGKGDARRLLVVTVTKDGFDVSPYSPTDAPRQAL
jgi:hypothetical protein